MIRPKHQRGVLAYVFIGVVLAFSLVLFFGYSQYQKQATELKNAKTRYDTAEANYQSAKKELEKLSGSAKINNDVRVDTNQAIKVVKEKIFVKDQQAEAREQALRAEYAAKEQNAKTMKELDDRLSELRIAEIWKTYCMIEPKGYDCVDPRVMTYKPAASSASAPGVGDKP